jgi:LPXTG-site transpeptidase (sortase) family protein
MTNGRLSGRNQAGPDWDDPDWAGSDSPGPDWFDDWDQSEPRRPASLRWGWLVVVAGVVVASVVGWLEYTSRPTAPGSALATARPPGAAGDDAKPRRQPAAPPSRKPAETQPTKSRPLTARPGRPEEISLPSLGVTAPVLSIKARGGSLIPPADPRQVGWWSDGAQPGARIGSAVITGHTVHNGGGAFDNIDEMQPGDTIEVNTSRGELQYEVTKITVYRKKTLARHAGTVFDQGVPGRLVLVTCEDWDGTAYLSNAVIYAKRIG